MVSKKLGCLFDNGKLVRIGFEDNLYNLKTIRKPFLISPVKQLKC